MPHPDYLIGEDGLLTNEQLDDWRLWERDNPFGSRVVNQMLARICMMLYGGKEKRDESHYLPSYQSDVEHPELWKLKAQVSNQDSVLARFDAAHEKQHGNKVVKAEDVQARVREKLLRELADFERKAKE